jgi:AraC-like DNA-binding protein/ligand-binding sensor protein
MSHTAKYIFQRDVQSMLNCFTKLLGIRIVSYSDDGKEISDRASQSNCQYCQLLKEQLDIEDQCHSLNRKMQLQSAQQKKVIRYQCHGGMVECAMPLYVSTQIVGYVMIGQFRISDKMPSNICDLWAKLVGTDELERAYHEAPCFKRERINDILEMLTILVGFIIDSRMVNRRGYNSLDSLLTYMEEHIDENLRISQAAGLVFRSKSGFSLAFKTLMGKCFNQYQIDLKLAKADEYFQVMPDITIREVARKLGYKDPLYFSRLYRKHRGTPPLAARKQLQSPWACSFPAGTPVCRESQSLKGKRRAISDA